MTDWLTPREVATRIRRDPTTVYRALECGEMHGHQRVRRGRWQVSPESADAFVRGADGVKACGCGEVIPMRRRSSGGRAAAGVTGTATGSHK